MASHNQLHMYGFSNTVNLLSISPGTALQNAFHETQDKTQPWMEVKQCIYCMSVQRKIICAYQELNRHDYTIIMIILSIQLFMLSYNFNFWFELQFSEFLSLLFKNQFNILTVANWILQSHLRISRKPILKV